MNNNHFNVYIIRFNSHFELKNCFNSTNELKLNRLQAV